MSVLLLLACAARTDAAHEGLRVDPEGWVTDRNGVRHATRLTVDGVPVAPRFQRLLAAGDRVENVVFGQPASRSGALLPVCGSLDYSGLWAPHGDAGPLEMVTHFECQPGALFRSVVETPEGGDLRVSRTERVDATPIEGGAFFCAGSPTTWASHLAGEEYEPDARRMRDDGTLPPAFEGWEGMARWRDGDLSAVNVWDYGWVVELPAEGPPARRFAMGRFSHELALAMPDERTVYLTDDTYEGGTLFLFQADRARDLSSGTLWAARWDAREDGSHALSWRSLGHANDADLAAVVARRPTFAELYEAADPVDGACAEGAPPVWTTWGAECLRVRAGMEVAASRLESRRAAALAGATSELLKMEGLALDPEGKHLFLALTKHEKAATAGQPPNAPDQLRLAPNACGAVWTLALGVDAAPAPDAPTGPWVAASARPLLTGVPTGDRCDEAAVANPDNLAWMPGTRTLLVAEDGRRHARNALWAYDTRGGTLQRLIEAPTGAEVTGIRATAYRGNTWLSVAFQHPAPQNGVEVPSFAGTFGPLPAP